MGRAAPQTGKSCWAERKSGGGGAPARRRRCIRLLHGVLSTPAVCDQLRPSGKASNPLIFGGSSAAWRQLMRRRPSSSASAPSFHVLGLEQLSLVTASTSVPQHCNASLGRKRYGER